jgi:hypothetical protein
MGASEADVGDFGCATGGSGAVGAGGSAAGGALSIGVASTAFASTLTPVHSRKLAHLEQKMSLSALIVPHLVHRITRRW